MTEVLALLQEGRKRELEQALFYRVLSGVAEDVGAAAAAERLNELLADEQHHISRLTARILELGAKPLEYRPARPTAVALDGWEAEARRRETDEVAWYEEALTRVDDTAAAAIFTEILACERQHHHHLAGKWMSAGHNDPEETT